LVEAEKYCIIALDMHKKLAGHDDSYYMAPLTMLTHGTTFTLTRKLSDCLAPLKAGYKSGFTSGNIQQAMLCSGPIGWVSFHSGQQLKIVAKTLDKLKTSISDFQALRSIRMNRIYRSAVDYCLGVSRSPRFSLQIDPNSDSVLIEQTKFIQLVVACFFCDYEMSWQISTTLNQFGRTFAGTCWPYICEFYMGMAAIFMLNLQKCSQFIRAAKRALNELQKGQKKAPVNLSHQYYLLKAEYCVFRRKWRSAEKFFCPCRQACSEE